MTDHLCTAPCCVVCVEEFPGIFSPLEPEEQAIDAGLERAAQEIAEESADLVRRERREED